MIGWPSPNKAGTAGVHGSPLGAEEARETKLALGLDPEASFEVPEEARAAFARRGSAEGTRIAPGRDAWRAGEGPSRGPRPSGMPPGRQAER